MTIGIVVDNYKLSKFQEELTKERYVYITYPFTTDSTTIKITTTEDKTLEIKTLCIKLEKYFKNLNK